VPLAHLADADPAGNGLADDGLGGHGVGEGLEGRVAFCAGGAIGTSTSPMVTR
jgi:hypothetical protein